jgi:hypothetical protein
VALCYVVAIQAFLSAFETTIAAAHAPASDTWLVICHGVDSNPPSSGGSGNPEELPCVLCAVAAAALGLLSDPVPAVIAQLLSAGLAGFGRGRDCLPAAIASRLLPRASKLRLNDWLLVRGAARAEH